MSLQIGSRLGHDDVTARIGEGGMGQVCRVRDPMLDRDTDTEGATSIERENSMGWQS